MHCGGCRKQCKGQRDLSIHKAKSSCRKSTSIFSSTSSTSYIPAYFPPLSSSNMVSCTSCGNKYKGQHGLAIHKAKSSCGNSASSFGSSSSSSYISTYSPSSSSSNMVSCDSCGNKYKGKHGLAIHKAKSNCGYKSESYKNPASLSHSGLNIRCDLCGKEFKGQHGLSIHKAKSSCGSSLRSASESSSTSSKLDKLDQRPCEDCGETFKGERGLIIHRAKSKCGRLRRHYIEKSVDKCTQWLDNLNPHDLHSVYYDPSIYIPDEYLHPNVGRANYDISTVVHDINKESQPIAWPEINIEFKEKTIIDEERFYEDAIGQAIVRNNDWRLNTKTFVERISHIFNKNLYFDIKFVSNDEKRQIVTIGAHKFILALASPVFFTMFYGSLPMDNKVVVKDVSANTLQNILQYLYTNSISLNDIDDAIDTHYASKKYLIYKLEKKCEEFMNSKLDSNVFQVYEHSILMELKDLEEKCREIMKRNPEEYLRSGYFLNMNLEIVMKITEMFYNKNLSNSLLAQKIVEWAVRECKEQEIYKTETNLNSLLEPILDKINSESFSVIVRNLISDLSEI